MKQAIVIFPSDDSLTSINLTGYVLFMQFSPLSPVNVEVKLSGLSPDKHGFHIHEKRYTKRN